MIWHLAIVVVLCLSIMRVALGGELNPPVPRPDRPTADELWMRQVWQEWNNWPRVTSNPNGSVRGQVNDVLVYDNAGTLKLCVNDSTTSEGTTWVCTAALTSP